METITVNLYRLAELSETAKRRALDDYDVDGDYINQDFRASMEVFCKTFGVKLGRWEVGAYSPSFIRVQSVDMFEGLQGNDLADVIRADIDAKYLDTDNCPLTGVYCDCALVKPLADFLAKPDARTYIDVTQDCFDAFARAWAAELEYLYTDEATTEAIEANNCLFREDGRMWR